jgi:hypothetical protein
MDDDEVLRPRHMCAECGALAPQTQTNYTLISVKHRWRLVRTKNADGTCSTAWYCAACWPHVKGMMGRAGTAPAGNPKANKSGSM